VKGNESKKKVEKNLGYPGLLGWSSLTSW